jgi:hypothetical protein
LKTKSIGAGNEIVDVESGNLTFLSSIVRLSFPAALPVDKSAGSA